MGGSRQSLALLLLIPIAGCGAAQGRPGKAEASKAKATSQLRTPAHPTPLTAGMVLLPGGRYVMGSDRGLFPYEGPAHTVEIDSFWVDLDEVTNDAFQTFITASGYVTEAEKFGWSAVFDPRKQDWLRVDGADWQHPEGPGSSLEGRGREPVVQISWNDAAAYAKWAGKRLPTEAEFEYALREGGKASGVYPWGDELAPKGRWMTNIWQGDFPAADLAHDGHRRAAPVGSFPPGPFGLHDLTGNVWEWCADWYDDAYYQHSPARNPLGPDRPDRGKAKVLRGGSFLCSENYCLGYRVTARSSCDTDSGTNHMGFRCVLSASSVSTR
ncbi:MAG TPA: formylglycine-generating enzyme family protein [Isosphaeraceae bacterium]|jgi:formylglycine-generating enzyme required for sulfatase activity|nr:formylglycine-generating enzyme family protein [Isosphaeraceae bacterium]